MVKKLDLSVVIPTLNEEKYIGKLLDSIAYQTISPKEIVIVDAFSQDKTINEIKKRQKKLPQLKYFQIPKDTISKQRNFGAKKTRSKHILFLDADMNLKQKDALEVYIEEIEKNKPDIASATNLPDSNYWKDKLFFKSMDAFFKLTKPIWPMANTMNLYITRDMFNKVGGFDEEVRIGEDHELIQRVVKNKGKFIFLKQPKLHTSVRRLEMTGRRKFILLMGFSLLAVIFIGYKKNPTKYEFGKFTKRS